MPGNGLNELCWLESGVVGYKFGILVDLEILVCMIEASGHDLNELIGIENGAIEPTIIMLALWHPFCTFLGGIFVILALLGQRF